MRAYLELVRLPNLFTAMADVAMGYLIVAWPIETPFGWLTLALLLGASTLLYAAGVTLNDVMDLEIDRQERPERPLPSGRIDRRTAARLGWGLLLAGVALGVAASVVTASLWTTTLALALAGAIVAYNALLKRTPLGPPAMGACRALNVLLGMSVAGGFWTAAHGLVAAGVGTYVAGLTWLARREAGRSRRAGLVGGIAVMVAGVGLLAWLPAWQTLIGRADAWRTLMVVLAILVAWRCRGAVLDPSPRQVQMAVKQSILALVVLDAAVTLALAGSGPALAVLALIVPAAVAGQWIGST